MSTSTPQPIADYVHAANAHDTESVLAAFTADAVVSDEGHGYNGHDEIREWSDRVIREYQAKLAVISVTESPDETVARVEVAGTFDGSPIQLNFHFIIKGNKIAALSIQA